MSPRKLTEEDKKQIIQLYRTSEATTSTLAEEYEVSSSTISRFLKNNLSESEYEELIQQKRLARTSKSDRQAVKTKQDKDKPKTSSNSKKKVITSTSSSSSSQATSSTSESEDNSTVPQPKEKIKILPKIKESLPPEEDDEDDDVDVIALEEMLGEEIEDIDEDDDDYEEDDWDNETDEDITYPHAGIGNLDIEILPLANASFPRTCYLVIDRSSELITRPLEDFADLGTIPEEEIQQKTLPVFDNHRVARRFSHRRERVIKVPDGRMLQKTSSHLEAKGITRLLIDGQVYSLSN